MTVYHVYNQGNYLISTHKSPSEALKQALIYQHQYGSPAYVESEVVCLLPLLH
jgi:hypothetical protein